MSKILLRIKISKFSAKNLVVSTMDVSVRFADVALERPIGRSLLRFVEKFFHLKPRKFSIYIKLKYDNIYYHFSPNVRSGKSCPASQVNSFDVNTSPPRTKPSATPMRKSSSAVDNKELP